MEIYRVSVDAWRTLSKYHYLGHTVSSSSAFYGAFIDSDLVAVVAINRFPHPVVKDICKVGRVVVNPKWQGYGLGMILTEYVVENYYSSDRVRITTTLPIMHRYLFKSDKWKLTAQTGQQPKLGKNAQFKKQPRQVYTETYQYIRSGQEVPKTSYVKISKDERKDDHWKDELFS